MSGSAGRGPLPVPLGRQLRRRGLLPRPRHLRKLTRLAASLPTRGNDLDLIHEGDEFYRRLLEDIRKAQVRVHIEMYMFLSDRTGWRIAHALMSRARAGVQVRIVFDSLGSLGQDAKLFQGMEEAGIELLEYHPIAPWRRRFAIFRRNHRKNIIIDGGIAYTGGMNFGNPWASKKRGGEAWRDTQARVQGPAAGDLETLFAETWHQETGTLLDIERLRPRDLAPEEDRELDSRQVYVVGGRGSARRKIRRLYLLSIGHARRSVTITCSYFAPDRKLRKALAKACERGVQVRLMLPQKSDVPLAQFASEALYDRLLRWGAEIYLWKPTVLHAKTAIVDGGWSTVGSSNLDQLSFRLNLETNLVVVGADTGHELEDRFEEDLRFAQRVELETWNRRPRFRRIWEQVALLFRRWV